MRTEENGFFFTAEDAENAENYTNGTGAPEGRPSVRSNEVVSALSALFAVKKNPFVRLTLAPGGLDVGPHLPP